VFVDNTIGIQLGLGGSGTYGVFQVLIQNNLITANSKGISITDLSQTLAVDGTLAFTIVNNNIQSNRDYNLYLGVNTPINATFNWWGTNDQLAVNQTIYDIKNDYNLGKVTSVPYLSAPEPTAPTYNGQSQSTTPIATPASTTPEIQSPTQTPTSTEDAASATPTQHPEQSITQNNQKLTLSWPELAVLVLCIIVGTLTVTLILVSRKHKVQPQTLTLRFTVALIWH
jgi:hypothetical protein